MRINFDQVNYVRINFYQVSTDLSNDDFSPVKQKANLLQWLESKGGILVTHNRLLARLILIVILMIIVITITIKPGCLLGWRRPPSS